MAGPDGAKIMNEMEIIKGCIVLVGLAVGYLLYLEVVRNAP